MCVLLVLVTYVYHYARFKKRTVSTHFHYNELDYKPVFHEYDQIFSLVVKANEIHYFSDLFDKVLYMFRTGPLSIIRRYSWWWTVDLSETCTVKLKWSRYRPGVAQRVGRGIALLFHDRGTSRGWVASSTPRPDFTPGKDPIPILQEAGWTPGPVWTGRKSRPHRDLIPDRPARSSVSTPTELPGPHM